MPFFDDSGARPENVVTEPIPHAFALLRDQLERMVGLNVLWAAQGVPLLLAWAFPMPQAIRLLLTLYSAVAIPPATVTVFAVLRQVMRGEPIGWALLVDSLRESIKPGLFKLMPLYSLFFWVAVAAVFAADRGLLALDVLVRLFGLLLLLVSLYWGPLIVARPDWTLLQVMTGAVRLAWRNLEKTLLLAVFSAFVLLLGIISIAGLVLIVPVLLMLLQTEYYRVLEPSQAIE